MVVNRRGWDMFNIFIIILSGMYILVGYYY